MSFAAVSAMESGGQLSATQSKAVLGALLERGGGDPAAVAKEMGFEALGSDTLGAVLDEVIAANPDEWGRFVDGDDKLMGFFTGAVMKATSGKANGKDVASRAARSARLMALRGRRSRSCAGGPAPGTLDPRVAEDAQGIVGRYCLRSSARDRTEEACDVAVWLACWSSARADPTVRRPPSSVGAHCGCLTWIRHAGAWIPAVSA